MRISGSLGHGCPNARSFKLLVWLALGVFVLAPLARAAAARPSAHRTSAALLAGVNLPSAGARSLPAADEMIAQAHALHASVVRVEVPWSALQPTGSGQLEPRTLAYTDRLVSDAAADGIRVIMMVDSTPCWASSAPAALLRRCVAGRPEQAAYSWPASDPSSYASLVGTLVARYGTKLAALEVWNEPDQSNEHYFAGPHKATRYAALLRAAYAAVKGANRGVPVLAGSLVGSNGAFLRALYAAGIKGHYDGLSVHFYNLTIASLRSIHEVQVANGDRTPLWLAEFGWSSCWPRQRIQQEQGCVTARTQASDLADSLREMARMPYVAAAAVYKLQDSPGESFGVLSTTGARKPSFTSMLGALTAPFGQVSRVTVNLRVSGNHVIARGSGPVGDFMELDALQGTTLRYRSLFTLNRFNGYTLQLPAALGTSGLRVRVYQYLGGPGRAAQQSI
jgi:hypothetical protein